MMAIVTMMKFTEQMKLKWYKIWEEKLRTLGHTERGQAKKQEHIKSERSVIRRNSGRREVPEASRYHQ